MRDLQQINQMRVVCALPGMERVPVRRGIVYKAVEGEDLKLDVYYPPDMPPGTAHGAVLFVHGGSQAEHVEHVNESQPYISWCQLVAASGLIAVMFKHRTDELYTRLSEAAGDIDDLVAYVRPHSAELHIDPDRLALWTASSGSSIGLRTALRDTPTYIRCIVVYYGGMSQLNRTYFTYSDDEEEHLKEFSPAYYLSQADPTRIAPLFIAKAGLDRAFLNESIDECVQIASERNIPLTFMNHPNGEHGFDILNDDARSREIIKATLAFLCEHLERDGKDVLVEHDGALSSVKMKRPKRKKRSRAITPQDSLLRIIGIGASEGATDTSANKHRYLADAAGDLHNK